MNQIKRNEIALYTTMATLILSIGFLADNYFNYLKMLGAFTGIMLIVYLYYKGISLLLEKVFPNENKTKTLGANKSYTINYNFNEDKS